MARAVAMVQRKCVVETIEIDACLDESHSLTNTLTDHPVEEGYNITDHSRPDPDVVTLRCFISNTPLNQEQQTRTIREGSATFETTAANGVRIGAVDGRGPQAFTKLKKLRDEGTLTKVLTTLKTYESNATQGMAIQSLQVSRTVQNYDGLEFVVTLKQVRIVRNSSARDVRPNDKRTEKKKKGGSKVAGDTKQKEKSALKSLRDSGRDANNPIAQKAARALTP
jgi:hypothetical protein